MATDDKYLHLKAVQEVAKFLINTDIDRSPPEISTEVHRIIREVTNSDDPYKNIKLEQNQTALDYYPKLKSMISSSDDRLKTAVKLAIAGNVIDFGTPNRFDINETIDRILKTDFSVDSFENFKNKLDQSSSILYIGDNSGEIVFDRLLVEQMLDQNDFDMTFAVRSGPIINDATREDAIMVGLDKYAKIIEIGTRSPGTVLGLCTPEFKECYQSSDLIIAKGQGNYEALDPAPNLFRLLVVKCELVAKDIGEDVKVGDIVFANRPD
jgi:uncharacterized protein with ATP-grasp and redox domains